MKYKKSILWFLLIGLLFLSSYYVNSKNEISSNLIYGADTAPVEIINYTSFQCPPCRNFHDEFGEIIEKYMDSGEVKLIVKPVDLSKFEFDEVIAVRLNESQINSYSELTKIYETQDEWRDMHCEDEVIPFLNLDAQVNSKLKKDLKINMKEKQELALEGVPTTLMNGEKLSYDITPEEFEAKILELINK